MGTGYTRKDTANNIDDGNVINASDLDLEFDGIQSAFDNSTGHTHDGTAGEGAPIENIGPAQDVVATSSALRPKTDNTVDLGTTALEYKDLFLDGTAHIDTLDVDENASITGTLSVTSTSTFSDDVTFTGANYNVVWDTSVNALEFRDNAKAVFGNGNDLQIYHNGSNSFIADSGTGNLLLRGNNVSIQNAAGTETVAQFVEDSFVKLFHDNSQKFATTSAGISVTGDVDASDDLILSSDSSKVTFGADNEIELKHYHNAGLILDNTLTASAYPHFKLLGNQDTIVSDDPIGRISFDTNSTAGGVSTGSQAAIIIDATGTYSSTVAGCRMEFYTTKSDGTLSKALTIEDDQSIRFTGGTDVKLDATNDTLDFPDNFKIMMGAGDDLQLYHDSTNSYIINGTGDLTIRNTANDKDVIIQSDNGSGGLTSYIVADGSTGQTKLYHYGSLKFNTTSDGAFLTGNTFQVVGTAAGTKIQIQTTDSGESDGPVLELYRNSSSPAADDDIGRIDFMGEDSAGNSEIYSRLETYIETTTSGSEDGRTRFLIKSGGALTDFLSMDASTGGVDGRFLVNGNNNDIDTVIRGDTDLNLLYADASTDRIGIGTNSPVVRFHVNSGADNTVARFESTDVESVIELVDTTGRAQIRSRNDFRFYVAGDTVRAMDITSAGRVGIGTASPDTIVEIVGADPILTIRDAETSSASAQATLRLAETGASDTLNNYYDITADGGVFKIIDAWNEGAGAGPDTRIAIIDNGFIGFGTETPAAPLEIKKTAPIIRLTDSNNGSGGTAYRPHIELYAIDDKVGTIGFSDSKDLTIKTENYNTSNIQLVTQSRVEIETGGGGDPTTNPAPTLRLVNTTGSSDWDTDDVNGAIEWYTNDTSGNAPQVNAFIKSVGGNDNGTLPSGELTFGTVTYNALEAVERVRIDSQGNVGINTSQPVASLHVNDIGTTGPAIFIENASDAEGDITVDDGEVLQIGHWNTTTDTFSEKARLDSSGHFLVGRTSVGTTGAGHVLRRNDSPIFSRVASGLSSECMIVNKDSYQGVIVQLRNDGTSRVHIGVANGDTDPFFGNGGNVGLRWEQTGADRIEPCFGDDGDIRDNAIDLGGSTSRFDDIYATNSAIQTSDEREKQQIASLTTSEIAAAKAISKLFKTFKWNDSVEAKGDAARTHSGVIAQQVESAMTAEGLDVGDYAFFTSTTWWETVTDVAAQDAVIEDGITVHEAKPARKSVMVYDTAESAPEGATERNRKGIRYGELMSFIHAATEQRLASIESRLDALESA